MKQTFVGTHRWGLWALVLGGAVGCQSFGERLAHDAKRETVLAEKPAAAEAKGKTAPASPAERELAQTAEALRRQEQAKASRSMRDQLEPVGRRLAEASGDPSISFRFDTLHNPRPRTHHTADGHIYVSSGLLERVKTTDELAAMLALEMAEVLVEKRTPPTSLRASLPNVGPDDASRDLALAAKSSASSAAEIEPTAVKLLQRAGFGPVDLAALQTRVREQAASVETRPSSETARYRQLFAN